MHNRLPTYSIPLYLLSGFMQSYFVEILLLSKLNQPILTQTQQGCELGDTRSNSTLGKHSAYLSSVKFTVKSVIGSLTSYEYGSNLLSTVELYLF